MTPSERKIRVLVVKPGLDGHWRGAMVVSMALRDAGMEVIYGGNQSPENIVKIAIQEERAGNKLIIADKDGRPFKEILLPS